MTELHYIQFHGTLSWIASPLHPTCVYAESAVNYVEVMFLLLQISSKL